MIRVVAATMAAAGVMSLAAAGVQPEKPGKHEMHAPAPPAATPAVRAFDRLRTLAGEWRGMASHGEDQFEANVVYRVTAGGSAVVETLFPGTDHEMVSIYTRDGDSLIMTHYCTMANQPRMRCRPSEDLKELKFEFVDAANLASEADPHMHEMTLTLSGPDRIKAVWGMYAGGKKAEEGVFELERVKPETPAGAR